MIHQGFSEAPHSISSPFFFLPFPRQIDGDGAFSAPKRQKKRSELDFCFEPALRAFS